MWNTTRFARCKIRVEMEEMREKKGSTPPTLSPNKMPFFLNLLLIQKLFWFHFSGPPPSPPKSHIPHRTEINTCHWLFLTLSQRLWPHPWLWLSAPCQAGALVKKSTGAVLTSRPGHGATAATTAPACPLLPKTPRKGSLQPVWPSPRALEQLPTRHSAVGTQPDLPEMKASPLQLSSKIAN